jgi:hypothetical protein
MAGCFVARPIPADGFRKRDEVTPKRSAVESLRRIENGGATDPEEVALEFDGEKWRESR